MIERMNEVAMDHVIDIGEAGINSH